MKIISFKTILFLTAVTTVSIFCGRRREKQPKPPKQPKQPLTHEQKQVIVANIAQVMGGVCTIVQDPHNHHNVGNSVANMIHGLISIVVEKVSNRTIDLNDIQEIDEQIVEIYRQIDDALDKFIADNRYNENL